jgi:Tfp pilus assembly protein PilF
MQIHGKVFRTSVCAVAGLFLAAAIAPLPTQAQMMSTNSFTSRIAGSVLIDGQMQPAARVRVDVRGFNGSTTTFTDASGNFEAPAQGGGPVTVAVAEKGYEPVEQQVIPRESPNAPGVVITLHKLKATHGESEGYTVSVHNLKIPNKARRAFDKGLERLQKKDAQGSLDLFKEATDAFPDYYEAYYQIGVANLELRRGPEAEQALQKSIDLSGGGYARPEFALGALLCDRQNYTDAERVLRRAIDVDSSAWEGHLLLGQVLFGQHRLAEAEKSANEVLLRRPDIPTTYVLLANIHISRKEYSLAIRNLDTFLAMRPAGPTSDQARAVREAATRVTSHLEQAITLPRFVY